MTHDRAPGEFCWINILTSDTASEREFFSQLLGWQYVAMPNDMGHRIRMSGLDVGGMFDLASPQTPPGTPAGIGVMVNVVNADEMSAKAASLGGKGKPGFDIGEQGRMAECVDPGGAMFDLWQPNKSPGMRVDSSAPGAPSWFEVITHDAERVKKFYAELFGWTARTTPENPGYVTFHLGEKPVGGMLEARPDMGAIPSHWGVYFTVEDTDATARQAIDLGASVHVPPRDIPGVGRFAGIKSPRGVHFYVIRYLGRT